MAKTIQIYFNLVFQITTQARYNNKLSLSLEPQTIKPSQNHSQHNQTISPLYIQQMPLRQKSPEHAPLLSQLKPERQKHPKKKHISKSVFLQHAVAFIVLMGELLYSVVKLCWTLIMHLVMSMWTFLKPAGQKTGDAIAAMCTKHSLNSLLKHLIDVVTSLQHRIPEFIETLLTQLRQRGKKKSIPFSDRQQFSSSQLKDMYSHPGDFLQKSPSNQVLYTMKQSGKKRTITYYVPTYLRVLLKNFTAIDLDKLQAQVNADLIITFVYGNKGLLKLPKDVAKRMTNEVMLNFERDEAVRLTGFDSDHVSMKQDQGKSYVTFTVRRKFHMKIESNVFYTPFEKLDLLFPVTIQQITAATISSPPQQLIQQQFTSPSKPQANDYIYQAGIKFNYMDNPTPFVRLDFKAETDFGNYSLIQSALESRYSNKKILSADQQRKKKDEQQKQKRKLQKMSALLKRKQKLLQKTRNQQHKRRLQQQVQQLQQRHQRKQRLQLQKKSKHQQKKLQPDNFQYSLFTIPIYKHPFASLVMIFLPLWSLAIINLGIFFQGQALSQRIGSIAGVMIAFIALIPLIRSQIPPNPNVMFVEYLVYAEILASFLCLVDSLQVRAQTDYHMVWQHNVYYLLSLVIFLAEIIVITVMTLYHFAINVHNYELDQEEQQWKKDKGKNKFNHFLWGNKQCDKKFNAVIEATRQHVHGGNGEQWVGKLLDLKEELQSEKNIMLSEQSNQKLIERCLLFSESHQSFTKTDSILSSSPMLKSPRTNSPEAASLLMKLARSKRTPEKSIITCNNSTERISMKKLEMDTIRE